MQYAIEDYSALQRVVVHCKELYGGKPRIYHKAEISSCRLPSTYELQQATVCKVCTRGSSQQIIPQRRCKRYTVNDCSALQKAAEKPRGIHYSGLEPTVRGNIRDSDHVSYSRCQSYSGLRRIQCTVKGCSPLRGDSEGFLLRQNSQRLSYCNLQLGSRVG